LFSLMKQSAMLGGIAAQLMRRILPGSSSTRE
jgi:hypothetical protein